MDLSQTYLSLDLLFNLGPESSDYLHNIDISIEI